jgi:hypothetical protein
VRGVLTEAAWVAARAPGPLRAFWERTAGRRREQIATIAVARKLVVVAWNMLIKGEDYAVKRPAAVREKISQARAPEPGRSPGGASTTAGCKVSPQRREASASSPPGRGRISTCGCRWGASGSKRGAGATTGRASSRPPSRASSEATRRGPSPGWAIADESTRSSTIAGRRSASWAGGARAGAHLGPVALDPPLPAVQRGAVDPKVRQASTTVVRTASSDELQAGAEQPVIMVTRHTPLASLCGDGGECVAQRTPSSPGWVASVPKALVASGLSPVLGSRPM